MKAADLEPRTAIAVFPLLVAAFIAYSRKKSSVIMISNLFLVKREFKLAYQSDISVPAD